MKYVYYLDIGRYQLLGNRFLNPKVSWWILFPP